jgi:sortase A
MTGRHSCGDSGGTSAGERAAPRVGHAAAFIYDPEVAASTSAARFWLDVLRRRRGGRIALSAVTMLLFVAGAGMFAYPLVTDLYTDRFLQERLSEEFAGLDAIGSEGWDASLTSGDPVTRISIPDLDVETVVVSGTSPVALRAGAGHFPDTALPGRDGNVAIAGHRTTYGRPFNRIDELPVGAEIWLETPVGDFQYVVVEPAADLRCEPFAERGSADAADSAACITDPQAWQMIAETEEAMLTLMACHPKGSAAERIWIRAELAASHEPGTRRAPGSDGP